MDEITIGANATGRYDWYVISVDDGDDGNRWFVFATPKGKDPLGEAGRENWRIDYGPFDSERELRKHIFFENTRFHMHLTVEVVNDEAGYYSSVLEDRPVPIEVRVDVEPSVDELLTTMLAWAEHGSDTSDIQMANEKEIEEEIFRDYESWVAGEVIDRVKRHGAQ